MDYPVKNMQAFEPLAPLSLALPRPIFSDKYISRDISWLSFNERVLQEAQDHKVPLLERLKFLGIFSSNLDEFFRVRVASLKRLTLFGKKTKTLLGKDPKILLHQIHEIVLQQNKKFDKTYKEILKELSKNHIFIINERKLSIPQKEFVRDYFRQEVRPALLPIVLEPCKNLQLKNQAIYLAVLLYHQTSEQKKKTYALVEVPTELCSRFLVLPSTNKNQYVILLEDIIRFCIEDILLGFTFSKFKAYTLKVTRDAELDIDNDISEDIINKFSQTLKQRQSGAPVRFVYDKRLPKSLLNLLVKKLHLKNKDHLIPGGRYHNFKDFIYFPHIGHERLRYPEKPALLHPQIPPKRSLFEVLQQQDILLHYPYHSFNYMIDFLREASVDPAVKSIKITLYRVAKKSNIINALINATKNGKTVTVFLELQARFDEEANIQWAKRLEEEGICVIPVILGLKVHAKICIITRQENGKLVQYANIGTGNYNEQTAQRYHDESYFTTHREIIRELNQIFQFLEKRTPLRSFKRLLVSPSCLRSQILKFLDIEIKNARQKKPAYGIFKMNSLSDKEMIDKLYEASQAGVKIQLIIRGICSLIPGVPGLSENIRAISIVDKYLEHSRIFVFCNGGNERYYVSSADWMTRNLSFRIEVACPILDPKIQKEIQKILEWQLRDNTKSRLLNEKLNNCYTTLGKKNKIRSQEKNL
jgi:polyphosphate kinase